MRRLRGTIGAAADAQRVFDPGSVVTIVPATVFVGPRSTDYVLLKDEKLELTRLTWVSRDYTRSRSVDTK